ncbi:hypothetical protein DXG01_016849 [Tephrocybe rancida]|nr:hypothetical protein DXG01_016849 [Tephrocybe rancida]
MPPVDNTPIAPAPDGKESSLGKRFLDRVKSPKSTKSSSASSTPAAQLMENQTASSAVSEKPSLSKRFLAPFKGSMFVKSSSTPSTPAARSVENLAALGIMSAMNVDQGSPATPAAASSMSAMNVNESGSVTTVPNLAVYPNNPARNPVSLTNDLPGPNVSQDPRKIKEGMKVAFDGILTVLRVAKEASDWNPFLKAALGGIMAVVDLAKIVSSNSEDMKDTVARIEGLLPILETSAKRLEGHKNVFGKEKNLMNFAIAIQTELMKIQEMQSHGLFRHVLQGSKDATTLLGVYKNISESLEQFKKKE